jgi:Rrf2 family protein
LKVKKMLALTKKTDYALLALSYLARTRGALISAREIARLSRISLPVLTNILKTLVQSGITVSERGASGGYRLARGTDEITLESIISAIEGPLRFVQCTMDPSVKESSGCELADHCPIRYPAQRINVRLREFLESVTLGEVIGDYAERISVNVEGCGEHSQEAVAAVKE